MKSASASDESPASFIRKVLCSHQANAGSGSQPEPLPIEDLLPPLTSSNEVDLQLYAFISILIKEYVYTWYTRISPDHVFVSEVVQIIAHCTRALEERARVIDFEALIFDDIAELLDAHIHAFRMASKASLAAELHSKARLVYHTLRPHPGLEPVADVLSYDDAIDEDPKINSQYRQMLSQALLSILLPTEDLQNPCLRALVSEVAADLIIGNFIGHRICDANFVYDSIRKASNVIQLRFNIKSWASDTIQEPQNRLNKFGLLSTSQKASSIKHGPATFPTWISALFQYIALASIFLRQAIKLLTSSTSLPARRSGPPLAISPVVGQSDPPGDRKLPSTSSGIDTSITAPPKPFLKYRMWQTANRLCFFASTMPWVSSLLSLVQHVLFFGSLKLGSANSRLDRLIAHLVASPILPISKHLPLILLNLRLALFPGNTLPPTFSRFATPDTKGKGSSATAKRAAAFAILNLIPEPIAKIYFAAPPAPTLANYPPRSRDLGNETAKDSLLSTRDAEIEVAINGIEEILDVFSDDYMNRHLVYAVMEKILVAIVPELAEGKTVADLLAERGIGIDSDVGFDVGIDVS